MPPLAIRAWKFLGLHPNLYLGLILCIEAGAATVSCLGGLEPYFEQCLLGEREILATHHIQSTLLPIAYPTLLGWAEVLGSPFGQTGMDWAASAMQIALMLLAVLLIRAVLATVGSLRFASTTALIIGLYPPYLGGVKKINDANLTFVALLLLLLTLLRLRRLPGVRNALLLGTSLGCAVLIRPNLVPMVLLLFWPVRSLPFRRAATMVGLAISSAVLVYVCVTAAVHGRPFYPHNGPYNFYAGYNPYTEATLRRQLNAEDSILPALADNGMHPRLEWKEQADLPGVDDSRDQKYAPYYLRQAKAFIREHPATAVRLAFVKLMTMMRQSYDPKHLPSPRFRKVSMIFKQTTLLLIPCWCGLLIYSKLRHLHVGSLVVLSMIILYVLPFILTNADPRFRITIEGIVLLDMARMLYKLYMRNEKGAGTPGGLLAS